MKDNIPGFPGYHVTKDGKVYSRKQYKNYKLIKCKIKSTGYKYVTLRKESRSYSIGIHRLVAMVYIPNPNNYPVVMHLDDNKTNNKVENLQWGTILMNNRDAHNKGLISYPRLKGDLNPSSKISNRDRIKLCKEYDTGLYSQRFLAKKYGISQSRVRQLYLKFKKSI